MFFANYIRFEAEFSVRSRGEVFVCLCLEAEKLELHYYTVPSIIESHSNQLNVSLNLVPTYNRISVLQLQRIHFDFKIL